MNRVLIRVIGAPLLLAALGACLFIDWKRIQKGHSPVALPAVLCFFSVWSFHELCAMGRLKGLKPYEWIGWILLPIPFIFVVLEPNYGGRFPLLRTDLLVLIPGLWAASFLLSMACHAWSRSPRSTIFTVLSFGYMNFLACSLFFSSSTLFLWWLLFLLATGKGSDMAAYVVGKTMGRHKMAPKISPNKTWEGAIAGLIAGSLLGWWVLRSSEIGVYWACYGFNPETGRRYPCTREAMFSDVRFLVIAVVVCAAAQCGDLVKSMIKRWAGVKDSGRLLPEFGGTLDMVDSFILNAPAAILAYEIMRLVAAPC